MASLTQWTWVWVNSGIWWWTGRPGVLWFIGLQRVGHDWATELNWSIPLASLGRRRFFSVYMQTFIIKQPSKEIRRNGLNLWPNSLDRSGLENGLQCLCMAKHFYMLATFLTTSDLMCWLIPNSLNLSYFSHLTSYSLSPCHFYSSATVFFFKYSTNEMCICSFVYSHT